MADIFKDILGVAIYLDDILIFAKSKTEHDDILKNVLNTIKE